jgi:two-component system chemotaxis sensor kinase CheA
MVMNSSDELLAVFKDEVQELLDVLISAMEQDPAEWDLHLLFRTCHNIKGAARIVDSIAVREAAHALEDLFDSFRNGVPVTDELFALAQEGYLLLESCFSLEDGDEIPDIDAYRDAISTFIKEAESTGAKKGRTQPRKTKNAPVKKSTKAGGKASPPSTPVSRSNDDGGPPEASSGTIRIAIDKLTDLTGFTTDLVSIVNTANRQRAIGGNLQKAVADLEKDVGANEHPAVQQVKERARELYGSIVKGSTRFQSMSEEFKDALQSLRMIRVDSASSLLKKEIRDSSRTTGRSIEFKIIGGDTEIDRSVLDVLRDPLIHLIRNSVAHGIEPPEEREKSGKSPKGTITLSAASRGQWVEIRISDDGRGIDIERVRSLAIEKKLFTEEDVARLSDQELSELLFAHGFTTAQAATEVSGRGVGLEVVRKNLSGISGGVSLDWTPGVGTEFTLRVPLTRLTIKGLLVRLGTHLFAVPSPSLLSAIRVVVDDIISSEGKNCVLVDGDLIPMLDLERILGIQSDAAPVRPALVLSAESKRAFVVDEIIGEAEFLIQELSWNLRNLPGVAGSTLIDGFRIALVLNTDELLGLQIGHASFTPLEAAKVDVERKRILIVDDSVTSRTLVKNILTAAGYEVVAAIDGQRGWDELRSADYDLVVADIEMPRMDGIELTEKIRADVKLGALPVVLVTSLANEEYKTRGADAGADSYIVKGTFDQDELLLAVERLL